MTASPTFSTPRISSLIYIQAHTTAVSPRKRNSQNKAHNFHVHTHSQNYLSSLAPDREEKVLVQVSVAQLGHIGLEQVSFIASSLLYHTQLHHTCVRPSMYSTSFRGYRLVPFITHSQLLSFCFCHAKSFYYAPVLVLSPLKPPSHYLSITYVA